MFRTSESGFNKATRRRRRVHGKVLTSTAHPARSSKVPRTRGAGLLGGFEGGDAVLVRRLAYSVFVVLLVAGGLFGIHWLTETDGGTPALRTQSYAQAMGADAGSSQPAPEAAEIHSWTIRAAHYNGTHNGQLMASTAQAELQRRGWRDVLVLGYPDEDDSNLMLHYELVVGRAGAPEALAQDLAALRAIADWPGGNPAPFLDARVVGHPLAGD